LALAGCRNVRGVAEVRTALGQAGYGDVTVSFRSGGGIDLVRIDATAAQAPDDQRMQQGAAAVWSSLPFRFDRLRLSVTAPERAVDVTYSYEQLAGLFGPRPPGLDRRQVGDEVVVSGLKLVVLLSVGALLSVGLVLGLTLFALRNVRRRRRRLPDDGSLPISLFGEPEPEADDPSQTVGASPAAGASLAVEPSPTSEAEGPEAIPS
ncbi:MAG: hypothetical protein M3Y04_02475, partial [Actinomycetota bacterium]|nr:hypothetical protein [Actinomycetota bacterium]